MKPMPKTLKELRAKVDTESDYIGIRPYSHNIIGLCLQQIAEKFGRPEANRAIVDYGLDKRGWTVRGD